MASQTQLDDIVRTLELCQEQYLRSLRLLQEQINQSPNQQTPAQQQHTVRRRERADSRITVQDVSFTPPMRAMSGPTFTSATDVTNSLHPIQTLPLPGRRSTLDTERPSVFPSPRLSAVNGEGGGLRDDDVPYLPLLDQSAVVTSPSIQMQQDDTPRAVIPLATMSFEEGELLKYIRSADLGGPLTKILEDTDRRETEIDTALSFRDYAAYEREGYLSANFEIFEVASDASVQKTSVDIDAGQGIARIHPDVPFDGPIGVVDAPLLWDGIKDVNKDGDSVGRMTIVQEPTPLMLAALHLTMSPHFDMSEILQHLISDTPNRNRTKACVQRAFERAASPGLSPQPTGIDNQPTGQGPPSLKFQPGLNMETNIRQRSFFFVFKYYTVVHEDFTPAPWQKYDKRPSDKRLGDHVDIAECGSILALSLGGNPVKAVRQRPRRGSKKGFLFDTFGPWHLLSIQSFPDDHHTQRTDEFQQKSFYNGPYAFMDALIMEYRDAGKRNLNLHEDITKLITPPTDFMFNRRLRDKLLFEDKNFTYIRRYFWAYNTLAVINTGIKSMITAYQDAFTEDFWSGSDPYLWPHPSPHSEEGHSYRAKMALLRRELEKVVNDLDDVRKMNERTRKEIENLREQLFSGSSIKESRRAIDSGDNIRTLTMISMIFLPLTFVTSVWGMTEFNMDADEWPFALTMVLVCVPFMLVVILLQTRLFTRLLRRAWAPVYVRLAWLWDADVAAAQDMHPQGRKRRSIVVDGAKAAATQWRWWPWTHTTGVAAKGPVPADEVELGKIR